MLLASSYYNGTVRVFLHPGSCAWALAIPAKWQQSDSKYSKDSQYRENNYECYRLKIQKEFTLGAPSSPHPGLLKLHLHFRFVFYHSGCQPNLCCETL